MAIKIFKFYEVGGKVRDELLGLTSKDIDYVAVPNMEYLSQKLIESSIDPLFRVLSSYLSVEGFDIFLETPEMYTIRARFPKGHKHEDVTADFVLARKEIGYVAGTRKPIVVPGTLLDDLTRRDFTVNAIAKDEDGVIYDPFYGRKDLNERVLRTPISGDITFDDDPLRLLRAIRFKITKGFDYSPSIATIIGRFDYKNKFHVVSEERIREELYKCFKQDTLATLAELDRFFRFKEYIFNNTKLWLKPTNEQ